MGTMSSIDHSSAAHVSAHVDVAPLIHKVDEISRILDFIAKKDVVNVEAVPKIEVHPAQITISPPTIEPKVAVPITVPMPTVNVANHMIDKTAKILSWLIGGDLLMRLADLAWRMAHTTN